MNVNFVKQLLKSTLTLPLCPCQMDSMETIYKDIKRPDINFKRIQDLIRSSPPDLKIISDDRKVILSHKLLFGLVNSSLAKILLEDDFIGEHVTMFLPVSSATVVSLMEEGGHGEMERIFSNTLASYEDDLHPYSVLKPSNSISITKIEKEEPSYNDCQEMKDEADEVQPVTIKIQKKKPLRDEENSETCFKCERKVSNLSVHRIACEQVPRGTIVQAQRGLKVICPICNKEKTFQYFESTHYYKCSNWKTPGSDSIREKYEKKMSKLEEPIPCSECGKTFPTDKSLKSHYLRFHKTDNREIFQCDKCEFKTDNKYTLKGHMIHRHTTSTYVTCELCGCKLKSAAHNIAKHMRVVHTQHEMIKCEKCGKQLKKIHYKSHINKVHSESKHSCHLCNYKAQTSYNLKRHIHRSHLGLKEIPKEKCQYCEVEATNMPLHMKDHHPEI